MITVGALIEKLQKGIIHGHFSKDHVVFIEMGDGAENRIGAYPLEKKVDYLVTPIKNDTDIITTIYITPPYDDNN